DVGTDAHGATAQIVASDGAPLDRQAVTATVEIDGTEQQVTLQSGGVDLVYVAGDSPGSVWAVRADGLGGEPIFTVTPDVSSGTYAIVMQGVVDPIVPDLGGDHSVTFTNAQGGGVLAHTGDAPFTMTVTSDGPGKSTSPYTDGSYLGVQRGGNSNAQISDNESLTFRFGVPESGEAITRVEIVTAKTVATGTINVDVESAGGHSTVYGGQGHENIVVE